ncbi:hypothetical protein [Nocardioides cynanchi]|uniref:hypothetical protein n=1 Tax=Nocardioides cynanchi TaxID=2558918 RepID=UPI0012477887|nr:hypothetical protein [Nocardioides cynanchi]
MSLGDAVLTFVSVFVAALLAFYLEGLRERRATADWVRDYLRFWRTTLESTAGEREANQEGLQRIDDALGRWLDLGSSGVEPVWADLDSVGVNAAITFTPLLLSSGVSAVPGELLRLMFVADASAPALLRRAESVARLFEAQVLPLVLSQVTWLQPEQRHAVERYRVEFAGLRAQMNDYLEQLDRIRHELVQAGF